MILYILNLADLASTFFALSIGLDELNPIARFLFDTHPMLAAFVKIVPMFFLCRFIAKCGKKDNMSAIVYWILVGWYAATVVLNIGSSIAVM
jgi:hypothetical protein